jgi:hypothetical protein
MNFSRDFRGEKGEKRAHDTRSAAKPSQRGSKRRPQTTFQRRDFGFWLAKRSAVLELSGASRSFHSQQFQVQACADFGVAVGTSSDTSVPCRDVCPQTDVSPTAVTTAKERSQAFA